MVSSGRGSDEVYELCVLETYGKKSMYYVCVKRCTCVHMYVCTCVHVYMCTCVYTYVHTYVRILRIIAIIFTQLHMFVLYSTYVSQLSALCISEIP